MDSLVPKNLAEQIDRRTCRTTGGRMTVSPGDEQGLALVVGASRVTTGGPFWTISVDAQILT